MLIGYVVYIVTPVVAVIVVASAWYAWRERRARALVPALIALVAEGAYLWLGYTQFRSPVVVPDADVPGIYAFQGRDFRDEIVLSPEGSFVRTLTRSGSATRQGGRWEVIRVPHYKTTAIGFSDYAPGCVQSPVNRGASGGEPVPLCTGASETAMFCRAPSEVRLCFGELFEYSKQ